MDKKRTKARNLAGRDVTDDVDLVALLLGPLDLAVDPVQVTPRVVKVEHQPKIEVVAEVGVHGQEAEAGSHRHLVCWRFRNLISLLFHRKVPGNDGVVSHTIGEGAISKGRPHCTEAGGWSESRQYEGGCVNQSQMQTRGKGSRIPKILWTSCMDGI